VSLAIGVQPMVRSDQACSGVMFTLDTESGFRDVVVINGAWGLGEAIVQGMATPDEWIVFKPTLATGARPIVSRRLGTKEVKMVYGLDGKGTRTRDVVDAQRQRFCLSDYEVLQLANWACMIEKHYSELAGRPTPMDLEWAKDGNTGELFILQARPETVHATNHENYIEIHKLTGDHNEPLATGIAVGERIGQGQVHVLANPDHLTQFKEGAVLVTSMTDPAWEPIMKKAAAIVTDRGGRTCHSAIVSRELGLPCIVGTGNATHVLQSGMDVTVCCAEGARGSIMHSRCLRCRTMVLDWPDWNSSSTTTSAFTRWRSFVIQISKTKKSCARSSVASVKKTRASFLCVASRKESHASRRLFIRIP
jgi:pyruvate,water dikinase